MTVRNKVLVTMFLEEGCNQEDGEVSVHWRPINFDIYSELFAGMISEAAADWLAEHDIEHSVTHKVMFAHVVERDAGGAVMGEYFEDIYHEKQAL